MGIMLINFTFFCLQTSTRYALFLSAVSLFLEQRGRPALSCTAQCHLFCWNKHLSFYKDFRTSSGLLEIWKCIHFPICLQMQEMVDAVSALIIGPVKQVPVRPHVFPGCSFQDTQLFFLHQAFHPYHESVQVCPVVASHVWKVGSKHQNSALVWALQTCSVAVQCWVIPVEYLLLRCQDAIHQKQFTQLLCKFTKCLYTIIMVLIPWHRTCFSSCLWLTCTADSPREAMGRLCQRWESSRGHVVL